MDVEELKKRWIRGLICPPLFYLPVKQNNDIIIKTIVDDQEFAIIQSISIYPYNMTPGNDYNNLIYDEENHSYSPKFYDPFTKTYFDNLNEAGQSYYNNCKYNWIDKDGNSHQGTLNTNVVYPEDKTFIDKTELRYPIDWGNYSTIINFIENPVEIVVGKKHYKSTDSPNYFSVRFDVLQSKILIKNLKPGVYQINVASSDNQEDYPDSDRKQYSTQLAIIHPKEQSQIYPKYFTDETNHNHYYSFTSNYYISSKGTISDFGHNKREYSGNPERMVADELYGIKAPYENNTLLYDLKWNWIYQDVYCLFYYKIIDEDYSALGSSSYILRENLGIITFKNLIYEEEDQSFSLPSQKSEYQRNIYQLKVGEHSYSITQMPTYIKNYWGNSALYFKLDSSGPNDKVTITKTTSSNPTWNKALKFYFSPEQIVKAVYCIIDGYPAFKMYIGETYKGYFQIGELYKNGIPVSGFTVLDYIKQNYTVKKTAFIFENSQIPEQPASDTIYFNVTDKESLAIEKSQFYFSSSCQWRSYYGNLSDNEWVRVNYFYNIPIMAIYCRQQASYSEYEHNWISYWNCYNDTNGINYNNRSCQNYYFLGDGLTKEDLGLMFSGFNRVVVENEDEQ